jgi:KDO2-lipid IV(A) lauroyltransferase
VGAICGQIGWWLRVRRSVVLSNIARTLSHLSPRQRRRLGAASYRQFGRSMFEYGRLFSLGRNELPPLRVSGEEHLLYARDVGRGAVFVTGHFGSWEVLGALMTARGLPIDFLVGSQHNRRVDALMNEARVRQGIGIIHIGVAARGVLSALRKKRFVAMLADQDARRHGVMVPFFGQDVSAVQGPAVFARQAGAPVVFGVIVRARPGFHFLVAPPIMPDRRVPKEAEIERITAEFTRLLERAVRRWPDHWFWAHRRFKTTDRLAADG